MVAIVAGSALAGMVFVDAVGYAYHRWVEHGQLQRVFPRWKGLATLARRHAIHHCEIYPPGRLRPETPYITRDRLSWYLPGAIATVLTFTLLPLPIAVGFGAGGWAYGLAIDALHRCFHLPRHALSKNRVFLWLQSVHDLHHSAQDNNFTIVVPVMDWVGRSFRVPGGRWPPGPPQPHRN